MPESPPSAQRRSDPEAFDLGEFVAMLERHRRLCLAIFAAVVVAGMVWSSTRAPVYRTSATLKLEREDDRSGVLGDLAALTSAPAAEGEMSILRSRSLLEATVTAPAEWNPPTRIFTPPDPDDFRMDGIQQLGLTTAVEDADRLPLNDLWRAFGWKRTAPCRLFARIDPGERDEEVRVRVRFPASGRVRLSMPTRKGFPDRDEAEFDYAPGVEIAYASHRLRLEAVGAYEGGSFLVSRAGLDATVEACRARIDVEETSRNSGVIRLTVSDSDPERAAELANALSHNYLLRSIRIGRSRATRTIDFVTSQLEEQKRLLGEAEREVVELQRRNPSVILVSASAESLIERLAEREADRTRLGLARRVLSEVTGHLDAGDPDALARLSPELPDLLSTSYLEAIGRLGGESAALDRSDAGPTKSFFQRRLDELDLAAHEARARLAAVDGALEAFRSGDRGAIARLCAEAPSLPTLDPTTGQYLAELARLDAELSARQADLTPENPDWKRLLSAREDLERRIAGRLENIAAGLRLAEEDRRTLEADLRSSLAEWPEAERGRLEAAVRELSRNVSRNLHARIASLESEERAHGEVTAALEAELASLPERERAIAEPLRRREAHAQIVKLLLESQQQAQLSAATTLPSAILVDPAVPPSERHAPKLLFHFLLSTIAGAGLAVLAAFGRQALSGAIHSQAEVEEATGLAVLGSIPDFRCARSRVRGGPSRARPGRSGFLPLRDDPDGPISEAFRSVRENLRFALPGDRALRTLAFTSCGPGEGKSTANISLAMAFAGPRCRVLLVDADLRKPTVHANFSLPLEPGLGEVLEGRADWRSCIRSSGTEGLDLLCSGRPQRSPGDVLRSSRFAGLFDEWKGAYDLVVFDFPPALAVADVDILARELDAIVLLYRSGGAHREALAAAARRLSRTRANVVGAVLNAIRPTRAGSSASYGSYGYGYGDKTASRRRRQSA